MADFFTFEKIKTYVKAELLIYAFINVLIFIGYHPHHNGRLYQAFFVLFSFGVQLAGYHFMCRWSKNFYVFVSVVCIGIAQLVFYLYIKNVQPLFHIPAKQAVPFRNTLILILFFQLLRYISLKTQYQEPVAPSRRLTAIGDPERYITNDDIGFFFLYIAFFYIISSIR